MKQLLFTSLFLVASLTLLSCSGSDSEDKEAPFPSKITIDYEKTFTVETGKPVTINNEFIASFKDGKIKGDHIGTTTGYYDNTQKIDITVEPTIDYTFYPYDKWGASLSEVDRYMKENCPSVDRSESGNVYTYFVSERGEGSNLKFMYFYTIENNKLTDAGLCSPFNHVKTYVDWMMQKYFIVPNIFTNDNITAAGFDAYDSKTSTTGVALNTRIMTQQSNAKYNLTTNLWILTVFLPYNSSTRSDNGNILNTFNSVVSEVGINIEQ